MASSEKTRILVYCVFFFALLALAAFYQPVGAMSRCRDTSNAALQTK